MCPQEETEWHEDLTRRLRSECKWTDERISELRPLGERDARGAEKRGMEGEFLRFAGQCELQQAFETCMDHAPGGSTSLAALWFWDWVKDNCAWLVKAPGSDQAMLEGLSDEFYGNHFEDNHSYMSSDYHGPGMGSREHVEHAYSPAPRRTARPRSHPVSRVPLRTYSGLGFLQVMTKCGKCRSGPTVVIGLGAWGGSVVPCTEGTYPMNGEIKLWKDRGFSTDDLVPWSPVVVGTQGISLFHPLVACRMRLVWRREPLSRKYQQDFLHATVRRHLTHCTRPFGTDMMLAPLRRTALDRFLFLQQQSQHPQRPLRQWLDQGISHERRVYMQKFMKMSEDRVWYRAYWLATFPYSAYGSHRNLDYLTTPREWTQRKPDKSSGVSLQPGEFIVEAVIDAMQVRKRTMYWLEFRGFEDVHSSDDWVVYLSHHPDVPPEDQAVWAELHRTHRNDGWTEMVKELLNQHAAADAGRLLAQTPWTFFPNKDTKEDITRLGAQAATWRRDAMNTRWDGKSFLPRRVLGMRVVNQKHQFLVAWEGYGPSGNTWENATDQFHAMWENEQRR